MTDTLTGTRRAVPVWRVVLPVLFCSALIGACTVQEPLAQAESITPKDTDETVVAKEQSTGNEAVVVSDSPSGVGLETVGSIEYDGMAVSATVVSNGCTTSQDFSVEHVEEAGTCRLQLVRNKRDLCRRAPFVASVSVPWEAPAQCENLSIVFENPIANLEGVATKRSIQR